MFIRFLRDYQAGNGRMYQGGEVLDVDKVWGNSLIAEGAAALSATDAPIATLSLDSTGKVNGVAGADGVNIPLGLLTKFRNKSPVGWHSVAGYVQTAVSPGYDGRTYQLAHAVEAPVLAVRCVLLNNEATTPTINAVSVSPSDTLNTVNFNPTNGAYTPVTFGGSASVVLPARSGVNQPSRTTSDWVNVQSIAPVDGTTLPYMFWRAYYATGPASQFGNTSQLMGNGQGSLASNGAVVWPSASDARTARRRVCIADQSGNFTATAFTAAGQSFGCMAMEFEYIYDRDVITVCALGDSITQGDTASINALSPVHYACNVVSTPNTPVIPCNQGFSSQTTSNFVARLNNMISSGRKPQIVVYSAWSPNDISAGNVTAAAIALMKFNMAQAMAACEQNGIVMIVTTGLPYAYTAPNDANRVAFNNYLRGLASYRVIICDYDAVISNGATPAVMQYPAYAEANQSLHPYDGGYIAMGNVLATTLASTIAMYFGS